MDSISFMLGIFFIKINRFNLIIQPVLSGLTFILTIIALSLFGGGMLKFQKFKTKNQRLNLFENRLESIFIIYFNWCSILKVCSFLRNSPLKTPKRAPKGRRILIGNSIVLHKLNV